MIGPRKELFPPLGSPQLRAISLGAGVQSTTLALMAAQGEIGPMPDCAIFADTGSEPQSVYDHLRWLMSPNVLPFPVHIVSVGNLGEEIESASRGENSNYARPPFFIKNPNGSAGMLRRQCTGDYKIDPIRRKSRELLGYAKGQKIRVKSPIVEMWVGISTEEIQRAKSARDKWTYNRFPLIDLRMSRQDCLTWLDRNGYPRPPKSACTFCPYRTNAEWSHIRSTDPVTWQAATKIDAALRSPDYVHLVGEAYVHRSLKPLAEADLSIAEDHGQVSILDECDGMCGV